MSQDYYVILGIPVDSTQTDIKAAYRRLAKEFHPDYYGQNHEPFQVLQEAYSVLSDPDSRRIYDDAFRNTPPKQQAQNVQPVCRRYYRETVEPLVPGGDSRYHPHTSINGIFDQFFGVSRGCEQPETSRPEDVSVEVSLTPEQAQSGGRLRLPAPIRIACPSCHGQGYSRYATCHQCHGAGVLPGEKTVLLRYPAGIRHNQSLQFVLRPSPAGKIFLNVHFKIK
jgi:molecular chaperone DnaJ